MGDRIKNNQQKWTPLAREPVEVSFYAIGQKIGIRIDWQIAPDREQPFAERASQQGHRQWKALKRFSIRENLQASRRWCVDQIESEPHPVEHFTCIVAHHDGLITLRAQNFGKRRQLKIALLAPRKQISHPVTVRIDSRKHRRRRGGGACNRRKKVWNPGRVLSQLVEVRSRRTEISLG